MIWSPDCLKLKRQAMQKLDPILNFKKRNQIDIRKQHNLYVNYLVEDVKAIPRVFYCYIMH